MQQIMYQQTPWIVLDLPRQPRGLQHRQVDRLDAEVRTAAERPSSCEGYIASYLNLRAQGGRQRPPAAARATVLIVVVVVVVIVVAGVAVVVMRRRRQVEETD